MHYDDSDGKHDDYPSQQDLKEILAMMSTVPDYLASYLNLPKSVLDFAVEQLVLYDYKEVLAFPELQFIREMYSKVDISSDDKPVVLPDFPDDFAVNIVQKLAVPFATNPGEEDGEDGSKKIRKFVEKIKISVKYNMTTSFDGILPALLPWFSIVGEVIIPIIYDIVEIAVKWVAFNLFKKLLDGLVSKISEMWKKKKKEKEKNQPQIIIVAVDISDSFSNERISASGSSSKLLFNKPDYVLSVDSLKNYLRLGYTHTYANVYVKIDVPAKAKKPNNFTLKLEMCTEDGINPLHNLKGSKYFRRPPTDTAEPVPLQKVTNYFLPPGNLCYKFNGLYSLNASFSASIFKTYRSREFYASTNTYTIPDKPSKAIYRPAEKVYLLPEMMDLGALDISKSVDFSAKSFKFPPFNVPPDAFSLQLAMTSLQDQIFTQRKYQYSSAGGQVYLETINEQRWFNYNNFLEHVEIELERKQVCSMNCVALTGIFLYNFGLIDFDVITKVATMRSKEKTRIYLKNTPEFIGFPGWLTPYQSFDNHTIPIIQRKPEHFDQLSFADCTFRIIADFNIMQRRYVIGVDKDVVNNFPNAPNEYIPLDYVAQAFLPIGIYDPPAPDKQITVDRNYNISSIRGNVFSIERPRNLINSQGIKETAYRSRFEW